MITNSINLVELVADEGKKLTDKERKNTYSRITVRLDMVDDYIEITNEEAEIIENALLVELEDENTVSVEELIEEEVG